MDNSKILQEHKLKVTPARVALIELFSVECRPLDAQSAFSLLSKKGFDSVTIYRNLETMHKKGILRIVDLRKDSVHYELAHHHHHHIVCTVCGCVEEIDSCIDHPVLKGVAKQSKNFDSIDDHAFEFFGVCKKCS